MDTLKIAADGSSDGARSQARGKLFEKIVAEVLRQSGYEINKQQASVTYSGMEIDIEGNARVAKTPLYAECKCYSSNVNCEALQTFYGKYMTRWFSNPTAQGIFVALPGLNSPATAFYRDHCESNDKITIRLLQETEVLEGLIQSKMVVSPDSFQHHIAEDSGLATDRLLVFTNRAAFWVQYLVPHGAAVAKHIQIFNAKVGKPILDSESIEHLIQLVPELQCFSVISPELNSMAPVLPLAQVADDVVEVRGSSACFEYQFPASPEFFVGRDKIRKDAQQFFAQVRQKKTSARGMLFEANSGWGKSSLVLSTVDSLIRTGHYAISLDSRSATSPNFIMGAVESVLHKFGTFGGCITKPPMLASFDGAADTLIAIGDQLKHSDKLLVIFFDQCENLFYLPEVLSRLAQLCLKVSDSGTNVVIGFSWKTDVVGLTRDFPYRWRDTIVNACRVFHLHPFSESEISGLLDRLSKEIRSKLRKDLRFLLSECSQGYPWLLKKLCAHVKHQRLSGVVQAEMVRTFLNVEQLFCEDMQGLTAGQGEALRGIAKLAPVGIRDISEEFNPDIIQSLVDRRLIVKVGIKYDIYWDIFRDYLNTGKLPVEEVYLLRAQVGSILRAISILRETTSGVRVSIFKEKAGLSDGAYFNLTRDLRLLQLADITNDIIALRIEGGADDKSMCASVRDHLNDRLPRNRCINRVLRVLNEEGEADIAKLSAVLRSEFPYISAVDSTWETYARVVAAWLDFSELGIWEPTDSKLLSREAGRQVRERSLSFQRRRAQNSVPGVQFSPVLQVAERIIAAGREKRGVDWSGIRRSTVYKALSALEEMELINRKTKVIYVNPSCFTFVNDSRDRIAIARKAAQKWPYFVIFTEILKEHIRERLSYSDLAEILLSKTEARWKKSTAVINAKIMLDWARHLELVAGPQATRQKGKPKLGATR